MTWPLIAYLLICAAIMAGWLALLCAVVTHEIELAKWKREAERVHQYFENMRRVYRREA